MNEAEAMERYGEALLLAVVNRRRDLFPVTKSADGSAKRAPRKKPGQAEANR